MALTDAVECQPHSRELFWLSDIFRVFPDNCMTCVVFSRKLCLVNTDILGLHTVSSLITPAAAGYSAQVGALPVVTGRALGVFLRWSDPTARCLSVSQTVKGENGFQGCQDFYLSGSLLLYFYVGVSLPWCWYLTICMLSSIRQANKVYIISK